MHRVFFPSILVAGLGLSSGAAQGFEYGVGAGVGIGPSDIGAAAHGLSAPEIRLYKKRCAVISADHSGFDCDLVVLCRILASP